MTAAERRRNRLTNGIWDTLADHDREAFKNYFIGALSADVSDGVWDHAIKIAQQCYRQYEGRKNERRPETI